MLQLSKIIQSRDEWREKAKKRSEELCDMRKVHKYYKNKVANLIDENTTLKESLVNKQNKKK